MADNWDWVRQQERRVRLRSFNSMLLRIVVLLVFVAFFTRSSVFKAWRSSPIDLLDATPSQPASMPTETHTELPKPSSILSPPSEDIVARAHDDNPKSAEPALPESDASIEDSIPVAPVYVEPATAASNTEQLPETPIDLRAHAAATAHAKLEDLRRQLEGAKPLDMIIALAEFRELHSEYIDSSVLTSIVRDAGYRPWLQLSLAEAEEVSPDSLCFGEVWLPIASAWTVFGEDAEAREAMRRATEATDRILTPELQYRWVLDLHRHELFVGVDAEHLLQTAVKATSEVSDIFSLRAMTANLSGFAAAIGNRRVAATLLDQALAPEPGVKVTLTKIKDYHRLMYRAWAGWWTQNPEEIESVALALQRMNYRRLPLIADAYAHAAMAATRSNDSQRYYRMMFAAEAALSATTYRDKSVFFNGKALAESYLQARQWQNALIAGNNLTDPQHIASINLRVLARAPQAVGLPNLRQMFEDWGDGRYAAEGIAGFIEFRLRAGDDIIETVRWIQTLKRPALRAAAFAGVARAASVIGNVPVTVDPIRIEPKIETPRSLIEVAERSAMEIEDPVDSAGCLIEVARVWNLTGRQQSYDDTISAFHQACFAAWVHMWEQRSPSTVGYDGTFSDGRSPRQKRSEREEVARILQVERQMALMQADLGDTSGALETCLRIANHAGFLDGPDNEIADWHYLTIQSLLARIQAETGVGPDALYSRQFQRTAYTNAIVAAGTHDITALEAEIAKLTSQSEINELARAHAELAILYASRGDVDNYRSARRSAVSEIERDRAWDAMKSLLAVADARAGEVALASSSLVDGRLPWFDGTGWPNAEIAVAYAKQANPIKSLEAAQRTSPKFAVYPCRSFVAAGHAKFRASSADPELVEWVGTLKQPAQQVGAYCGLALAAEGIQLP